MGATTRAPPGADAVVAGPASDLLLWLVGRAPADGTLAIDGDRTIVDAWSAVSFE